MRVDTTLGGAHGEFPTARDVSTPPIVVTGLRFSGFSGLRVLELFVRVSGRVSGLIY